MKFSLVFVLLGQFLPSSAKKYEIEDNVLVMTTKNFDQVLNEFDFVLAEFYAPWCGHCQSLAPEFTGAAKKLSKNKKVALAKIDATAEPKLGTKYNVRGYPTLKWFKKGEKENPKDYTGGRKKQDIVKWVEKKTGPAALTINKIDEIKKLKNDNEVVVFGYFPEGYKSANKLTSAAEKFEVPGMEIPFALTDKLEIALELGLKNSEIVLFNKDVDSDLKYLGEGNEDLVKFIKNNLLSAVTEFTEQNAPKIFGGDIKKHVLLFSDKSTESHDKNMAAFTEASKNFKEKSIFVFVDCKKATNGRILEFFGIDPEKGDCPNIRFIEMAKGEMSKYKPEVLNFSYEKITEFVQNVHDGKIEKFLMSEEIPEKNDDPVFYLVSKQFKEICYNKDKAVLVEFYAPWCGHCKELAPVWEKLGEKYANNKKDGKNNEIIIAKTDATANEFDGIEIHGFPTIKFFPKGDRADKKVVEYKDARDLESLVKFIEKQMNPHDEL